MVKNTILTILLILIFISNVWSQKGIHGYLPKDTVLNINYVFYLHGRIVEESEDINYIMSPQFGMYNYIGILDSLGNHGRNVVISEKREPLCEPLNYARKISSQVDSLIRRGVSPAKYATFTAKVSAILCN